MADEIGLPDGWKSWPLPAKRFVRKLLVLMRDDQRQGSGTMLEVLDDLDQAEQAARTGDPEAAVAALGRVRDKLLGMDSL